MSVSKNNGIQNNNLNGVSAEISLRSSRWVKRLSFKTAPSSSSSSLKRSFSKAFMSDLSVLQLQPKACFSKMPSEKKIDVAAISRYWILRWRHCQAATALPQVRNFEVGSVGEQSTPSIAAMALMGRSMSYSHSGRVRKFGSLVAWA